MPETAETNFDEFKRKDCVFVADWLKTNGLHKLFSVFEGFYKTDLNCFCNVNNNFLGSIRLREFTQEREKHWKVLSSGFTSLKELMAVSL